jgi:uncharacterized damage-inducible protein DinB
VHPLEHYDILLRSRRKLMDWVRERTPEQYTQEFPFGLKTIRATVVHLADAEWLYGKRVRGEDFRFDDRPVTPQRYPDLVSLERGWKDLELSTRQWLEREQDWTRRLETISRLPGRKRMRVVFTPEKVAFQMLYHEVHHRAQIMAMLRQMGVAAENLDFSRSAYEWTELQE